MFSMLSPHASTLRSIGITSFDIDGRDSDHLGIDVQNLDLASFKALEQLCLHHEDTYHFSSLESILTAPRLRKFVWNFSGSSQYRIPFHYPNKKMLSWIQSLVVAARSQRHGLRHVHVFFSTQNGDPYELDELSQLRDEAAEQGIVLSYPELGITRHEPVNYDELWADARPRLPGH
ncbi:hypothetical protein QBC34DRAFT_383035 [Podospora aff. communis PSN243]|uniref:Uncharacterized protein n=1 Tax=Podospora aff. communis PSN243 TaxID=3040156 RepID=A0AAV9GFS4_9PEZI|nr:hypothetical protein QBC34DRAFT_383035 [Podospora aff. communis PSN243]